MGIFEIVGNAIFLFAIVMGLVITMDACLPREGDFHITDYSPKWVHKREERKLNDKI